MTRLRKEDVAKNNTGQRQDANLRCLKHGMELCPHDNTQQKQTELCL